MYDPMIDWTRLTPAQWTVVRTGFKWRMNRAGIDVHPEFYIGLPRAGTTDNMDDPLIVEGKLRCAAHLSAPDRDCHICTPDVVGVLMRWSIHQAICDMTSS